MLIDDSVQHARALYIDLEWTCWDGPPPPGMTQEIIEIGIVEMDLITLEITKDASCFIRPRRWDISTKCTQLTGITRDDILAAKPLAEVLADLTQMFRPNGIPCCAWGEDGPILSRTCASMKLVNPFRQSVDLCRIIQCVFALKQQPSLSGTVKMLGLEFDGFPHGALPDARNTARVHAEILRRTRQKADRSDDCVVELKEVTSLSPFAQKLAESLKIKHSSALSERSLLRRQLIMKLVHWFTKDRAICEHQRHGEGHVACVVNLHGLDFRLTG